MPILRTGLLYPDSAMLRHDLLLNEAHWQRYVYPFTSLYPRRQCKRTKH